MIRPLRNQLLLQQLPPDEKTDSGIFLAERYKPEQQLYRVLAAGPGRTTKKGVLIPTEISPGNTVLLDQYRLQSKVEVSPNTYLICEDAVSLVVP